MGFHWISTFTLLHFTLIPPFISCYHRSLRLSKVLLSGIYCSIDSAFLSYQEQKKINRLFTFSSDFLQSSLLLTLFIGIHQTYHLWEMRGVCCKLFTLCAILKLNMKPSRQLSAKNIYFMLLTTELCLIFICCKSMQISVRILQLILFIFHISFSLFSRFQRVRIKDSSSPFHLSIFWNQRTRL